LPHRDDSAFPGGTKGHGEGDDPKETGQRAGNISINKKKKGGMLALAVIFVYDSKLKSKTSTEGRGMWSNGEGDRGENTLCIGNLLYIPMFLGGTVVVAKNGLGGGQSIWSHTCFLEVHFG